MLESGQFQLLVPQKGRNAHGVIRELSVGTIGSPEPQRGNDNSSTLFHFKSIKSLYYESI
jgi:hypothetical protein